MDFVIFGHPSSIPEPIPVDIEPEVGHSPRVNVESPINQSQSPSAIAWQQINLRCNCQYFGASGVKQIAEPRHVRLVHFITQIKCFSPQSSGILSVGFFGSWRYLGQSLLRAISCAFEWNNQEQIHFCQCVPPLLLSTWTVHLQATKVLFLEFRFCISTCRICL